MKLNEKKDPFESINDLLSGNVSDSVIVSSGLVPLEKAPNPIIFSENKRFIGIPELYPFQFKTLCDFFELRCPKCNDLEQIKNDIMFPRHKQVLFEYDICPNCGYHKFSDPTKLVFYNELVGCGGMRGSKSALAALIAHSIVHNALCTENLQERLKILKDQTLEGAFVAVSATQAEETVWDHFMSFYEGSEWYQNYVTQLKRIEKSNMGEYELGNLIKDRSEKYLYFGDRKLLLKALHSNSASLAGRTRLFAIVDELSRFDTGASKKSALEVYRVMKNSLKTVGTAVELLRKEQIYDVPDARMICISSPIAAEDLTMQLLKEANHFKRMYSFHAPTWIMNPTITRESLSEDFLRDPLGAERDYGANPPGAENPFIDDPRLVEACIDPKTPSAFTFKDRKFRNTVQGIDFDYVTIDLIDVRYRNLFDYIIACDPGRKNDSFAISMGHLEDEVVVIDGALEIRPYGKEDPSSRYEVHFPSLKEILFKLNRMLTLKLVVYDRWNSVADLDALRDNNILAVGENLDREDHIRFYEDIRAKKIRFPKREHDFLDPVLNRGMPCSKAIHELIRLNDDGKKVDHGPRGSNDLIQTWVNIHKAIRNPEKFKALSDRNLMRRRMKAASRLNRSPGKVIQLKRFV